MRPCGTGRPSSPPPLRRTFDGAVSARRAAAGMLMKPIYIKVEGRWCYLYRAIDSSGAWVDVMFSEHRDMAAAKAFFRSARTVTGIPGESSPDGGRPVILLPRLARDNPCAKSCPL